MRRQHRPMLSLSHKMIGESPDAPLLGVSEYVSDTPSNDVFWLLLPSCYGNSDLLLLQSQGGMRILAIASAISAKEATVAVQAVSVAIDREQSSHSTYLAQLSLCAGER